MSHSIDKQLFKELQERGIVKQVTHDSLEQRLEQPISLYCGFDPTADSLHVGSLLPMVTMLRFKKAGHTVIPLVGGATGMIGDPSGKSQERTLNGIDTINTFKTHIQQQITSIVGEPCVDNLSWTSQINMIEFLRDFGKFFTVNSMLAKESVKNRIEREDQGISFTEFSYMLLQAMDFLHLFKSHNCQLQLGGSDQWGNITAGTELVRKKLGSDVDCFGLTMPLLTNSEGQKFGKSESGAVWLDPKKTSPFKFFQFWLSTSDTDVYKFLRLFSFKSLDDIQKIENEDKNSGKKPMAQQLLAEEMTLLVHGQEALDSVLRMNHALFTSEFDKLSIDDFKQLKEDGTPFLQVTESTSLVELLVSTDLAKSKRESRQFIASGAVLVNGVKETFENATIHPQNGFYNTFVVLKRGKKNFSIIEFV